MRGVLEQRAALEQPPAPGDPGDADEPAADKIEAAGGGGDGGGGVGEPSAPDDSEQAGDWTAPAGKESAVAVAEQIPPVEAAGAVAEWEASEAEFEAATTAALRRLRHRRREAANAVAACRSRFLNLLARPDENQKLLYAFQVVVAVVCVRMDACVRACELCVC